MKKNRILAFTLALSLLLTSCGGGVEATTMRLRKTEGTVSVSDGDGKEVSPRDDLGLYSGYGVGTQSESYAWIDLDSVKLTKMDADSEIEVVKDGKKLEIEVKAGSLFFNVTEPLADDESMNIRTSSMLVGIRGTCGWVSDDGRRGSQVYLLEGTVEAQAVDTGENVTVSAGEMAQVFVNENGETEIEVLRFAEEYIAPFGLDELEDDDELSAAILDASGLDALNPPNPAERLRAEYQEIIAQQTVFDHGAAIGLAYTVNGINYSADAGLSDAILSDLDGDGTQELIMVFRVPLVWPNTGHDVYNSAPIQKIEVYGQSMGYPVLYDTLDVTALYSDLGDIEGIPNYYRLIENESGQAIQLYAMYAEGGVAGGTIWTFSLEDSALRLLEFRGDLFETNWDPDEGALNLENLRPAFPEDVRRKQALLSALVSYNAYTDGNDCIYARLSDVNQDSEYELSMVLDRTSDGLRTEYYIWDGTDLERTVLASEPGEIQYGRFIDMDQDGSVEIFVVTEDYQVLVYSWKGASWKRTPLDNGWGLGLNSGLYRDTVSGDVYLGIQTSNPAGLGETIVFYSLTDSVECSYDVEDLQPDFSRPYEELTPAEQEEYDAIMEERTERENEFERELARFELIERIEYSQLGNNTEFFEQGRLTVEEVKKQLMER